MLDVNTAIKTETKAENETDFDNNNPKVDAKIDIIKETLPIYDSNIGKSNTVFNPENLKYEKGPYIDIDEKYLLGTTNIGNKIDELSSNLQNTKINLSERIDVLDEHIHKLDENSKNELININSKNLKEINDITSEKDSEIKQLHNDDRETKGENKRIKR